jgi:hypothetical protein
MEGVVDTIVERCAGIDIGKASLTATVRVQGGRGRKTRREVRTFGTTTPELLQLRDWLVEERVSLVGMESSDFLTTLLRGPVGHALCRSKVYRSTTLADLANPKANRGSVD